MPVHDDDHTLYSKLALSEQSASNADDGSHMRGLETENSLEDKLPWRARDGLSWIRMGVQEKTDSLSSAE